MVTLIMCGHPSLVADAGLVKWGRGERLKRNNKKNKKKKKKRFVEHN